MNNQAKTHFRLIRALSYVVFAFLILPVLVTVPLSFNSGAFFVYPLQGFSLRWYVELIENPVWYDATMNSLTIAFGTMVLATTVGTSAAIGLMQIGRRFASPSMVLLLLPNMVPSVIVAVAMFLAFAPLGLAGTISGLILAHTALAIPFVVITVAAALRNYETKLAQAAAGLGAKPLRAFVTVTLPLIAPGVLAGAIFAFGVSFDELIVALFLSSPETITLPRQLFAGINEAITPAVVAASSLLIALSLVMILVINFLQGLSNRFALEEPVQA